MSIDASPIASVAVAGVPGPMLRRDFQPPFALFLAVRAAMSPSIPPASIWIWSSPDRSRSARRP